MTHDQSFDRWMRTQMPAAAEWPCHPAIRNAFLAGCRAGGKKERIRGGAIVRSIVAATEKGERR